MRRRWLAVGGALLLIGCMAGLVGVALLGRAGAHRSDLRRTFSRIVRRLKHPFAAPSPPGPSAVRRATPQGVSVWILDDSTKVFRGADLGAPATPGAASVRLEAARGEAVGFQIVLAASEPVQGVEVEIGNGLEGPTRIPRDRVDVFLEAYVACPEVADKVVSLGPGEYPDALVPLWEGGPGGRPVAAPFPLPARRNTPLFVDLLIPRNTDAGSYRGSIVLRPARQGAVTVAIELDVLPFALPSRPSLPAWVPLYAGRLWKGEDLAGLEPDEARKILWRYFRMAHDHRFVTQIMEEEPRLAWDQASGALLHADWQRYDTVNGPALDGTLFEDREPSLLWKVGGFVFWGARPGDPPNFGGDYRRDGALTSAHRRALGEYVREIERHFSQNGWSSPQLFMYMLDEPDFGSYPNLRPLIRSYGDALHASAERTRHLVTVAPRDVPEAEGAVDIWAVWGAGYVPAEMQARQRLGERTWFYQQHEPFVGGNCLDNEGLGLRSWPWIARRYEVDAVFLWVGNFWGGSPYTDARNWSDDLPGNGILFYPGARLTELGLPKTRGPVSSFRMKALRRGLLDHDYFELLESLGGDAGPLVGRIVRSALNEKGYTHPWKHPLWAQHGDWSHTPQEWDAARREAGRQIVERLSRRSPP
jgi:hypothetical protein